MKRELEWLAIGWVSPSFSDKAIKEACQVTGVKADKTDIPRIFYFYSSNESDLLTLKSKLNLRLL